MDETPYIPLSWLRQERRRLEHIWRKGLIFTVHDLWLFQIRQEIDRLTIQELRQMIYCAKNQGGYEAWPCPLCEWDNGVFIKACGLHKQIEELRETNKFLDRKISAMSAPNYRPPSDFIDYDYSLDS